MAIFYSKTFKKYTLERDFEFYFPVSVEMEEHFKYGSVKTGNILLRISGELIITAGYMWDGPSGPTIDTKTFMRGSLIHDAFYQLMREDKLNISFKDTADRILQQCCIEDGMNRVRAWFVYKAVKRFGLSSAKPKEKKIYSAP